MIMKNSAMGNKRTMKASLRSARIGGTENANHNDRTFDATKAYHIDEEKSVNNRQIFFYEGYTCGANRNEGTFAKMEQEYYETRYGDSVKAQKERHIKSRHKKKAEECTVERLYESKKTCPKCFITQIGKSGEYQDRETLWKANLKLCEWLNGKSCDMARIVVLNTAMHCEETSFHCHTDVVFEVMDEDGNWKPSQEECLKRLGFKEISKKKEVDDSHKKNKRYENACIDFTDKLQQKWYDIVEELDKTITIDRVPNTKPHQKTDRKASKAQKKLDEITDKIDSVVNVLKENDRMRFEALERFIREKGMEQEFEDFYDRIFDQYYDWEDDEIDR